MHIHSLYAKIISKEKKYYSYKKNSDERVILDYNKEKGDYYSDIDEKS